MTDLWMLLAACGVATYLWRGPGVLLATDIDPASRGFTWIACVAYAIIAGLVSRMLVMPTGELAEVSVLERVIGSAAALVAYFWMTRRNLFVGVCAGAVAVSLIRMVR
jgi:branched-subunit amino acid transport protein